jgi:hypothetical protein
MLVRTKPLILPNSYSLFAGELRAADANLTLMVQADMLAYRVPGEPPQLGLPDRYGIKCCLSLILIYVIDSVGSPIVTRLVANVSAIYSPELHVGFTPVSPIQ